MNLSRNYRVKFFPFQMNFLIFMKDYNLKNFFTSQALFSRNKKEHKGPNFGYVFIATCHITVPLFRHPCPNIDSLKM